MKKVVVLFMVVIISCLVLTSCVTREKVDIIANYDSQTGECTIINRTDKDYKKIQITVALYNDDTIVDQKVYKLERFDKGEKYRVKIHTHKDITDVAIKEYKYHQTIFFKVVSNIFFVIIFGGIYWLFVVLIIIFMRISKITNKQD